MTQRAADLVAAARPQRVVLLLGGLALVVLAASWIDYDAVQVDYFYGIPSLTAGGLLLLAALLALVDGDLGAGRSPRHLVLALAFAGSALLWVDLAGRLDTRGSLPGLAELALAVVVVAAAAALREPVVAAGGVLLASAAAATLATPPVGGRLGFALVAAGAVASVAGLAQAIDDRRAGTAPPLGAAALAFVRGIDPRAFLVVAALAAGACTVAGLAFELDIVSTRSFDLNAEQTPPAVISSALLLWAGLLAAAFALGDAEQRTAWWTGAAFLAFLAFDEVSTVHEEFQELTGIKGQVFLLPLVLATAIAGLRLVGHLAPFPRERNLLVAGAVLWSLAQGVDVFQRPPDRFMWTVVPEEVLELGGSVVVALGLIALARAMQREPVPVPARAA